jgi:hypothetical protein
MFDLLALLTLLVSLMAPVGDTASGTGLAPAEDDGLVTTMGDGTPQPPGGKR